MKQILRWLLVPALVVGVGCLVRAQETGETRKTGKILILKTGLVMEGDIERVGTQMCIRRGTSEVWIAADKTLRLSPDWIDAYAYMQTVIRADRADDHVKLARWCHLYQLNEDAMEQARIALKLQPTNAEAKQIVTALERAMKEPPAKPAAALLKLPPPLPAIPMPAPASEPPPVVDVSAPTLIAFTTRVQPILMNKCASCHMGEGSSFRLERVAESGPKAASMRNLAAVLSQVDAERPAISPILLKSITPHGSDGVPALKDRSAKPFQAIEEWIVDTLKKNPQLKDYHAARKSPANRPAPAAKSAEGVKPVDPQDNVVSRPTPRVELTDAKWAPRPAALPSRVDDRDDPFDPARYNEWAHPNGRVQPVASTRP